MDGAKTFVHATSCEVVMAVSLAEPITWLCSVTSSQFLAMALAFNTRAAVAFATAWARASSISWLERENNDGDFRLLHDSSDMVVKRCEYWEGAQQLAFIIVHERKPK